MARKQIAYEVVKDDEEKARHNELKLSLDMGASSTRIISTGMDIEGGKDYRSVQAPVNEKAQMGTMSDEWVVKVDGQWWTFGEGCYMYAPSRILDYPTTSRYMSPWYRRNFAFALWRAFRHLAQPDGREIRPAVMSSIPAGLYKQKVQVDEVRKTLTGTYRLEAPSGKKLTVVVGEKALVLVPEGIGMYWKNKKLNPELYTVGTWLYLDFGYLTLDSFIVRNGTYVRDSAKSDDKCGLNIVAESVAAYVLAKRKVRLTQTEIDQAMRCDEITINKQPFSVQEFRDQQLDMLAERARELAQQWGEGENLFGVCIGGGPAYWMVPRMSINGFPTPQATEGSKPGRDNAIGVWFYLTGAVK